MSSEKKLFCSSEQLAKYSKKLKIKLKKGALDPVDFEAEKKRDPKYKTELCKSFMQTNFCIYGNQCRFAHGYNELVTKNHDNNYKKKECNSFFTYGFCLYGSRCNFKHDKKKLSEINFSYYQAHLFCGHMLKLINYQRLKCFEEITEENQKLELEQVLENNNENNRGFNEKKNFFDNPLIQKKSSDMEEKTCCSEMELYSEQSSKEDTPKKENEEIHKEELNINAKIYIPKKFNEVGFYESTKKSEEDI